VRASVIFNYRLSPAYLHLGIAAPGFPPRFRAGEFVMLRSPWVKDPLLPRAFSLYRVTEGEPGSHSAAARAPVVEILYKIVGRGTQGLSRMRPGDEVEILGPLGNSFRAPAGMRTAVLVAGGIGVPPISALAAQIGGGQGMGDRGWGSGCGDLESESSEQRAADSGKTEHGSDRGARAGAGPLTTPHPPPSIPCLEVFLGGKTAEDILCVADFKAAGGRVQVATEDGSLGARGLVTELVEPFLASQGAPGTQIYGCGPAGMLEAVGRLAEALEIPCHLSLEANMACGFGACMGCAVPVRGPEPRYKLCCKDGPVFEASEVAWE
jgi:dihydroorotate dehydrogenase electron transfer subunit